MADEARRAALMLELAAGRVLRGPQRHRRGWLGDLLAKRCPRWRLVALHERAVALAQTIRKEVGSDG